MLTSLLALLLGAWLSIKFSYITGGFLQSHFSLDGQYVATLSFVVTFLIVVFGVHLLGKLVSGLAKAISLGAVDKILGVVFGMLKTAFIISAIVAALNSFVPTSMLFSGEMKSDSKLYGIVAPVAPFVFNQLQFNLPENMPSDVGDILPEDVNTI